MNRYNTQITVDTIFLLFCKLLLLVIASMYPKIRMNVLWQKQYNCPDLIQNVRIVVFCWTFNYIIDKLSCRCWQNWNEKHQNRYCSEFVWLTNNKSKFCDDANEYRRNIVLVVQSEQSSVILTDKFWYGFLMDFCTSITYVLK